MRTLALLLPIALVPIASSSCSSTSTSNDAGPDSSTTNDSGDGTDSGGGTDAKAEGGGDGGTCNGSGATLAVGPCTGNPLTGGDVPSGCAPSVDGTLHMDEWADAACFVVGGGDMTVRIKYSGDAIYMATIGNPTCGCGMPFYFDPDGTGAASGNEFAISVFDDPFGKDGDRSDFLLQSGALVAGTVPAGIMTACPGNQPSPIPYEWKVPFSALGITAGTAHTHRMAIVHASAKYPDTLTINGGGFAGDPTTWGTFMSSANWQ